NSTMAVLDRLNRLGFVRGKPELAAMRGVHDRTRLKTAGFDMPVSSLSGGNQQKVLLAKWLLADPQVIFLDDPTRGIDVAAKQDVYDLIAELAERGKGVIFVSSELPELLCCCDRIIVLHDGRCTGTLNASDATQERIMALATRSCEAA
ncbi:MAG: sugar ABC transporter ATP-binding protein, partial [Betaproteobacteria bacterium]|nr:sugar ABC transporter ATP-binding protein [Betaproteobacteria bacterium]